LPGQLEIVGSPAAAKVEDCDDRRAGRVGSQRVYAVCGLHLVCLYTFVADTKRGDTKGQDLDQFGGGWYVLSTRGVKVERGS
jgi:hypothetical protein